MLSEPERALYVEEVRKVYLNLALHLNERSRRIWGATEAMRYGKGGSSMIHKAVGMAYKTIQRGIKEISEGDALEANKIRKKGGGRKSVLELDPSIADTLDGLMEPITRGDPESPLLWSSKSLKKLTDELNEAGHRISQTPLRQLLIAKGYSLQSNCKKLEGNQHQDRDAQFQKISHLCRQYQEHHCPVLSIDTKKKENIGNYKNNGREYSTKGNPVAVNTYDFPDKELGKVAPYGVYDVGRNEGWVSVGVSSDTASFAVNSIRTWWHVMGKEIYKNAEAIMITADCGGSNSNRTKLWKWELQKLANELQKKIHVSHFPPGTSKWNKIEHKMFSYISINWRGKPLISRETVVNLIANTRTDKGLRICAALDENIYKTGVGVSEQELASIDINRDNFHGEWNYTISPQKTAQVRKLFAHAPLVMD